MDKKIVNFFVRFTNTRCILYLLIRPFSLSLPLSVSASPFFFSFVLRIILPPSPNTINRELTKYLFGIKEKNRQGSATERIVLFWEPGALCANSCRFSLTPPLLTRGGKRDKLPDGKSRV